MTVADRSPVIRTRQNDTALVTGFPFLVGCTEHLLCVSNTSSLTLGLSVERLLIDLDITITGIIRQTSDLLYCFTRVMTKLSRETILKLANLSRLKLTEAEVEHFRVELTAILDYVSVLDGVNTLGLQPTYQLTGLKNVVRPDEANDYQAKATDLLKLAPAIDRNQFKVKRVLK